MQVFDLGKEQVFNPERHVEKVLGRIAEGDVTIACWEPGRPVPTICIPTPPRSISASQGGGVMRTPDATVDITPGSFVVHPPGELHEYTNGAGPHDPVPRALRRGFLDPHQGLAEQSGLAGAAEDAAFFAAAG